MSFVGWIKAGAVAGAISGAVTGVLDGVWALVLHGTSASILASTGTGMLYGLGAGAVFGLLVFTYASENPEQSVNLWPARTLAGAGRSPCRRRLWYGYR